MPLALSVKRGEDLYIGDHRFVVEEVVDRTHFVLVRESDGKAWEISDARAEEVLPDVMISAGESPNGTWSRAVIQAPREVVIESGRWRDRRRRHGHDQEPEGRGRHA